jgi:hypothetical protein
MQPQSGAYQQAILQTEAALCRAVLANDQPTARQLLADTFIAIGHAGNKVDKEQYLSIHFSPERKFVRFDPVDQVVQVFETIGLVIGRITVVNGKTTHNPPPAFYTAVYHRFSTDWHLISWQETPIQDNPVF